MFGCGSRNVYVQCSEIHESMFGDSASNWRTCYEKSDSVLLAPRLYPGRGLVKELGPRTRRMNKQVKWTPATILHWTTDSRCPYNTQSRTCYEHFDGRFQSDPRQVSSGCNCLFQPHANSISSIFK